MARILIGNVKHPLVNNGLTTEVGKYALDAAYGKTLTDKDTELENAITQLNSDLIKPLTRYYNVPGGCTVSFPMDNHYIIMCKHSGGSNYTIGFIHDSDYKEVAGSGDFFTIKCEDGIIEITSTTTYWMMIIL